MHSMRRTAQSVEYRQGFSKPANDWGVLSDGAKMPLKYVW